MTILSIDVGMKHLAYCVLEKGDDVKNYKIKDWNVIDLCNSVSTPKCMGKSKHDKQCGKSSKYCKNQEYYCKLHAKKMQFKIPTSNFKIEKVKKMKLHELKCLAIDNKYDVSKNSLKQIYINKFLEDLSNNYFDTIENIDSRKIDIITFGKRIKTCFNEIVDKYKIDCLLIENQIGPLALRMKMLQGMIMQHFIEIDCLNIKEISPANKLKDFIKKNTKTSYNERKKMGITITRELIENNNNLSDWKEHFEKHKKKDDLADAFLQVLWYIKQ
tara:strand:+ start:708 stop:1523 length:816 start_codon:yes stop_codon:yes gene_type:complete